MIAVDSEFARIAIATIRNVLAIQRDFAAGMAGHHDVQKKCLKRYEKIQNESPSPHAETARW